MSATVLRAPTSASLWPSSSWFLSPAARSEVRIARWAEIECNAAVWTVPAERINAGREHRMPLSDRALAVLDEAHQLADNAGR